MADDRHDEDRPTADPKAFPVPNIARDGLDARDFPELKRNPDDEDARLDIGVDETFPASDPPSMTQPGKGKDPAPSSGFKG